MLDYIFSVGMLAQGALLFYAMGFLVRDELILRGLILIGTGFYIAYYWLVADAPLWDAIIGSAILGVINIALCIVISLERTTFAMSAIQTEAYAGFPTLSPGQFRRIYKSARVVTLERDEDLLVEGQPTSKLYRFLKGGLEFSKDPSTWRTDVPCFVGEIAFISKSEPSASVRGLKGTVLLEWDVAALHALMERSADLDNALTALIGKDMAVKLGASAPVTEHPIPYPTAAMRPNGASATEQTAM